jgi:hypothetical protein
MRVMEMFREAMIMVGLGIAIFAAFVALVVGGGVLGFIWWTLA